MQTRRLGKTNLQVSPLCLGTMLFGDQTDQLEAQRIVSSAYDHGVNFIDTADVYVNGRAEEIVGTLLQGQRHAWVVATKLGNKMSDAPNNGHYSRAWIMREVDCSLRRLATEHIDILYLHRDFHELDLEEVVMALGDLIRSGKIRYFGLSNFRGWRIAEVIRLCERHGVPPPAACQPCYNLLNRAPEVEVLPACGHYGIGVVPYSPIARGVLTGKYIPGAAPPAGSRAARGERRMMETEFRDASLEIAAVLAQHAEGRGIPLTQYAVAWVLANKLVTSVIAGPRTLEQLDGYYGAVDVILSAEEEALVDRLVPPGEASVHGYTDPSHPFFGRPV